MIRKSAMAVTAAWAHGYSQRFVTPWCQTIPSSGVRSKHSEPTGQLVRVAHEEERHDSAVVHAVTEEPTNLVRFAEPAQLAGHEVHAPLPWKACRRDVLALPDQVACV